MAIDKKNLEKLASALYAFEDPDSEIPYLEPQGGGFKKGLKAYQKAYRSLSSQRKNSLKGAVSWLFAHIITEETDIQMLAKDLYRRIWIHETDTKVTEEIIKELNTEVYIKAIKHILSQATIT